ncbi:general stress protein [Bacillus paramobilis]|uniref:General stress protein n=1 Tax=Bacillus paramobilis TaxID=2817477 RepID=A0ABZ2VV84_9BACI
MHKNERKPVVHEYENEQEVVMKVKEQGLGTSIINFFSKKGDELRNQMEEMGLSKEEANLYEEKLDQGRILLLVTDETLTASGRQPQNYYSL